MARERCGSCCVVAVSFVKRKTMQVEVPEKPRENDGCVYEAWLQKERERKMLQALELEL